MMHWSLCHVWLQKVPKFRRYGTKLFFEDLSLHCDLDLEDRSPSFLHDPNLEDRNPKFLHDTPGHDDTPTATHQVSLS